MQTFEGCTLYQTSKILLTTEFDNLCCFCYEICKKNESPILSKKFDSNERCTCSHEGIS